MKILIVEFSNVRNNLFINEDTYGLSRFLVMQIKIWIKYIFFRFSYIKWISLLSQK